MKLPIFVTSLLAVLPISVAAQDIFNNGTYRWHGDTISQGTFTATAITPYHIVSDYAAQPGYYMGIEPEWKLKNDIASYPQLSSGSVLQDAIYNMALDEMVNAVEPDSTLRTGKAWGGVWTRDVSYSIILSMSYMQPRASMYSLKRKVNDAGYIIQDTGSGGAWPVSTDRAIWAVAAYEIYLATGDQEWLEYAYPIIKRSLEADYAAAHDAETGLMHGETSFIDWRTQSYPRWMQMPDITASSALGTSAVHSRAWDALSQMATLLGDNKAASDYKAKSQGIAEAINAHLWMPDKGYYAMYNYGQYFPILNPASETLGESLAVLWNIADGQRADSVVALSPMTPYGPPIFHPVIPDVRPYHNNAAWPWVSSFRAMAAAKQHNEEALIDAMASIYRPAALFCTNKENLRLDNGDIATELNSSNMLWCLAGNIALTHRILFGINHDLGEINFKPFVPEQLAARRTLSNFRYRDMILDITVDGHGDSITSFTVDGHPHKHWIGAQELKGRHSVAISLAPSGSISREINRIPAHTTLPHPVAWIDGDMLEWNPVEYTSYYVILVDGEPVDTVNTVTYPITRKADYQVIAYDEQGYPSFASKPVSNREVIKIQLPGEVTEAKSPEMCHRTESISGYTGTGFVETDHQHSTIEIPFDVTEPGTYFIALRYTNGNGPISTANKAALRQADIDGTRAGVIVMPQRGDGNWSDWGTSTALKVYLNAGHHTLKLTLPDEIDNINRKTNHALLDALHLTRL